MRRHYLDNIRWITVGLVVLYHVIFMYNGVVTAGSDRLFWEVQYQDAVQYLLYPWFMVLLFLVSGMCARYYLEGHTDREFLAGRTRKLLVPSTIRLFVFWWIQGYFNMAFSHVFDQSWEKVPKAVEYLIMILSGVGILWYIQVLWVLSVLLVLLRKIEKDRLYAFGQKSCAARSFSACDSRLGSCPDLEYAGDLCVSFRNIRHLLPSGLLCLFP